MPGKNIWAWPRQNAQGGYEKGGLRNIISCLSFLLSFCWPCGGSVLTTSDFCLGPSVFHPGNTSSTPSWLVLQGRQLGGLQDIFFTTVFFCLSQVQSDRQIKCSCKSGQHRCRSCAVDKREKRNHLKNSYCSQFPWLQRWTFPFFSSPDEPQSLSSVLGGFFWSFLMVFSCTCLGSKPR